MSKHVWLMVVGSCMYLLSPLQIPSLWCTSWRWRSTPRTPFTRDVRTSTCSSNSLSPCLSVGISRWSSSTNRIKWWRRFVASSLCCVFLFFHFEDENDSSLKCSYAVWTFFYVRLYISWFYSMVMEQIYGTMALSVYLLWLLILSVSSLSAFCVPLCTRTRCFTSGWTRSSSLDQRRTARRWRTGVWWRT